MRTRTPIALAAVVILTGVLSAPSTAASHDHRRAHGRIAFGAETATGTQIWTIWPNGTHLRKITHVDGDATQPDWSPDGRLLTFEWDTADAGKVAVMNANGSSLRSLPQTGCEFQGQPVFSADQQRIIYERFDCDVDDSLFSQPIAGGNEARLTNAFPDGHTDPNVSPDGSHISYVRFDNGVEFQQALTVADADGSNAHDLLPPSADIGRQAGLVTRRTVAHVHARRRPGSADRHPRGQRRDGHPQRPHQDADALPPGPPQRIHRLVLARRPLDRLPAPEQRHRPVVAQGDAHGRVAPAHDLPPGRSSGTQ